MLRSGAQNQKWPRSGPGGYITHATLGVPDASKRGTKSKEAHKWARWLHNPCHAGVPHASERGTKSKVAHEWAQWPHNPCCVGGFQYIRAGNKSGYITLAMLGVPHASQRGTK